MFGSPGTEHIAKPGMLAKIIGGSFISGPTSAAPPKIWEMITSNKLAAYNVPSGIIFDMLREGSAKRPGVFTKIGLETKSKFRHIGYWGNVVAASSQELLGGSPDTLNKTKISRRPLPHAHLDTRALSHTRAEWAGGVTR